MKSGRSGDRDGHIRARNHKEGLMAIGLGTIVIIIILILLLR